MLYFVVNMDKSGHLFVGGITGAILILLTHYFFQWFIFDLNNLGFMILIIYIYSLLPDIDAKSSQITWTFIPIGLFAIIFAYYYNNNIIMIAGISLIAVTFLAAQFLPHRGFTHTIIFGFAVSLPWLYLSWHFVILAFLCFWSHLIADSEPFKIW